ADALRARYGLNRSIGEQYRDWLFHAVRLDFGQSLLYDAPVGALVRERAANTAMLAATALALATLAGVPPGIFTGSRRGLVPQIIRSASVFLLSLPSLITSLTLVAVAARTGWFRFQLAVPVIALALPIAAMFERLQSQAMTVVLRQPYVLAA